MRKGLKIAIQGIRGSFHHEASRHLFGADIELDECRTFDDVVTSTQAGAVDYGVMAIENSLAGCIIPNYNLVRNSKLEVCGEVGLRVKLNLMAQEEVALDEIKEVHSHQMALRQCASFLNSLNGCQIVEAYDTAGSAKRINQEQLTHVGAIAGKLAAEEHGLNIIHAGIEDHDLNYTRFLVLKKPEVDPISDEINKLSVYFQTSHSPGSLAQLLSVISEAGINLSKLQSHPVPSKNTLYGFFATLDVSGIEQLEELKQLLAMMTIHHQILGAYKRGETHG